MHLTKPRIKALLYVYSFPLSQESFLLFSLPSFLSPDITWHVSRKTMTDSAEGHPEGSLTFSWLAF